MAELSEAGILLHAEFEAGPDGEIATKSYLCPADIWTLGLGATEWPNGRAVGPNDFCTLEQAIELTNWSLRKFAACVDRVITRPMNPNQRSAFILLAYNIGEHAFEFNCTAARLFNEGADPFDVASAFAKWCKATSKRPGKGEIGNERFTSVMEMRNGSWVWVDPNGNQTAYFRALPGLLRASLSKACLFMSLDWRQACPKDAISINSYREWDANDNRWEDLVRKKTEFADVYVEAKKYPLAQSELVLTQPAPPLATRVPEVVGSVPVVPPVQTGTTSPKVSPAPADRVVPPASVTRKPEAIPAPPAAPRATVPAPPVGGVIVRKDDPIPPSPEQQRAGVNGSTTPGIDPSSAKSMLLSRRFWGLLMIITGRVVFAFYGADTLLKLGSDPLISEMFANVMVLIASSAWEYCGECLHTWGKARAKRALK